ncbi:hypothetical protein LEP1GSC060_2556 [Leptospira weilii serovar Ranarum str. ICFT]|uniref:Uncharacterized protein n=1 Tax=Leptospira weilii serovar Ranarum str. ICFT TaxID=1218598 RepID=N1WUI5_9LEPT|nr:hypothetical protein [Leptospira weilii]EMY79508.1 hypothetical protein LEP1GSC060_2556 [Leptospira weilii serovar Ranarum str. ICFT]
MRNDRTSPMKGEILKRKKDRDWVRNISSNVIRRDEKEIRNKRMLGAFFVMFLGLCVYAGFWFQDSDSDPDLLSIGVFEELENALDK